MQAYHNDLAIKEKYVARMEAHIKADELIRGIGFNEEGKGCAIGCILNEYNHAKFKDDIGPEWLARLIDILFENMSPEKSKTFPLIVLESINPGANLDSIKAPFLIYILEDVLDKFDRQKFPDVLKCIQDVIALYKSGKTDLNKFEWAPRAVAESAAWAAARTARAAAAAARAVAESAAAARAARAARAAAWAAAEAAAWAAAEAAAAARTARMAATAEYDRYADKLLELIKDCK